jgi:tryptophanase
VIEATIEVFQRRDTLRGLRIIDEPPALRHFTAKFAEI